MGNGRERRITEEGIWMHTLYIFKVAFPTLWFNPNDLKPSEAIAERGTNLVTLPNLT